ncbi:MAG: c-type cytochrome [Desulfocapsaceae bacterium]
MNYPVWYLPEVGGGLLIAVIAVLHVFVSHFAVGGGLYLIYCEKKGLRENNQAILDFTKRHARFFLLLTMVFGSITGVGIWFIIALVNPAATSFLIHTFVFGWAAEWVFFVVEIVAAFVYFYMFGKMDNRTHLQVGLLYFIAAWISLLLINGIIAFMLTPGGWLTNGSFWTGFFNPSFWPSLVFRTFIAVMLAGIYGYLSASFTSDREVRIAMTRFSARWSLVALAGALPSAIWYVAVLPGPAKDLVLGKSPTIVVALKWGAAATILVLMISLVVGFLRPSANRKATALVAMLGALVMMGAFEWVREAARRPYAVNELIFSNMIYKDDVAALNETGFLANAVWVEETNRVLEPDNRLLAGEELFIQQCYACHTLGGFNNDLKAQTAHMSFNALRSYIAKIHQIRFFMPPFVGTESEAEALAAYIVADVHGKELAEPATASVEEDAGKALFEEHCSACHDSADLGPATEELERAEILTMLASLDQISDEMVPFAGSAEEAAELGSFIYFLSERPDAPATAVAGEALFESECSACHSAEDMSAMVGGMSLEQISELLPVLDQISDEMMPFEGSAEEQAALSDYLHKLGREN